MTKQNALTYHEVIDVRSQTYVPALTGEIVDPDLTASESQALAGGQQFASLALAARSGHSRAEQNDTAITHATAHLIASAPVVVAVGSIVTGFVLLGWLVAGGSAVLWIGVELAIFGVGAAVVLLRSRRAGLEHTPAGVERYEIDARAKVAMYVVDRHCELVERLKGVRK